MSYIICYDISYIICYDMSHIICYDISYIIWSIRYLYFTGMICYDLTHSICNDMSNIEGLSMLAILVMTGTRYACHVDDKRDYTFLPYYGGILL